MFYTTTYTSPVGKLTLLADEHSLVGLWKEDQKYYGANMLEKAVSRADLPILIDALKWLDQYFAGEKPTVSKLALAPMGSPFRQTVWEILCQIPYGEVITYGEIAKKVADKMDKETMSSQAVGGAVGHNPISIIIPCHRVVGASGSLTGYAGGIDTKIKLLELEGIDMSHLFVPQQGTEL